jgi:hypothetical protein
LGQALAWSWAPPCRAPLYRLPDGAFDFGSSGAGWKPQLDPVDMKGAGDSGRLLGGGGKPAGNVAGQLTGCLT